MDDQPRPNEHRASDADRDVVAEDLREAFGEGRLDQDEYQRRLDAVWQSRTYGELDRLTADLPQPVQRGLAQQNDDERLAPAERKKNDLTDHLGEWTAWLGGAVIMIGIWGITSLANGELNDFWPAIPLAIWALVLVVSGFGNRSSGK